jgi:hypothetical protein
MYLDTLSIPGSISKSMPSRGAGAVVGKRNAEIAKALGMPVKKAPTIARKGAQPVKGSLVPKRPIEPNDDVVGKRLSEVSKAYRAFDPEDRRQRRLGMGAAGSAAAGGLLVHSGGKNIARESGEYRGNVDLSEKAGNVAKPISAKGGYKLTDRALKEVGRMPKKRILVGGRSGGKVAGGAALLGGAAALMADHHKRRWE